jgi:predicted DCC family thiol-disulfide oxidoreductase YuxK
MEFKLPLLVYDDQCPMCVRFKQGLERWEALSHITYIPLSDSGVFEIYPQINQEECKAKVHYIKEDGSVVAGGEVITEIIKIYPAASKLSWLLDSEVGKATADFFYDHLDKVRQKLKELDTDCSDCRSK